MAQINSYPVTIEVNGQSVTKMVEPRISLVDFIREELRPTGTHVGCEHGICGACSILLNGDPVRSCCMFAIQANGMQITTVEGLAPERGQLSKIQDAFCEKHALQCGFCTPGMMMAAKALLERNLNPTEDEVRWAISGNLCRCTGYQNIVKAILWAAEKMRAESN